VPTPRPASVIGASRWASLRSALAAAPAIGGGAAAARAASSVRPFGSFEASSTASSA
jgi:hypothetical protein